MIHFYLLSLEVGWKKDEIKSYLIDKKLISKLLFASRLGDYQEGYIIVEVPNINKFESYLTIPNSEREPGDPGSMIKDWQYSGLKDKPLLYRLKKIVLFLRR